MLAALLLGGCFSSPPLSTCKENKDCPDNLPVCQDGFCFHTSVNYTVPLCAGEGVTGECCDLHTGDGCQVTSQQLGVVTATMTSEWVAALTEDGTVRWFDEALDPAGESVLFGARGALAARGGEQPEVCALDERGLLCAAGPDSGFVSELKVVGAIGRGVVCSDGFSLVATGDAIYVPAENHSNVLPVPIGELPDGLGPVVHRPSGAVAVPTGAGTAVKLLLPHSQIYDLTTLRDFDVHQSELPGGVLGMALSEEKLYVASRHGRLVAVQLDAVPESTDGNWTSQSMEAPQWVASSVGGTPPGPIPPQG